jgi:hypothetical protein
MDGLGDIARLKRISNDSGLINRLLPLSAPGAEMLRRLTRSTAIAPIIIVGVIAVALLWTRVSQSLVPAASVSLTCPEANWDVGSAECNSMLKHVFLVQNPSSAPIRIEHISTNCGCIVLSDHSGKVIASHESLEIPIKLSLPKSPGPFGRQIKITADSRTEPDVLLTITGTAIAGSSIQADRREFVFGPINSQSTAIRSFTVTRQDGGQVTNLRVEMPENLTVLDRYPPKNGDPGGEEFLFELNPRGLKPGDYRDRIKITSTDRPDESVAILIWATIVDHPALVRELFFGTMKPGAMVMTSLIADDRALDSLTIESCSIEGTEEIVVEKCDGFNVAVRRTSENEMPRLVRGNLVVKCNSPNLTTLIPFRCLFL